MIKYIFILILFFCFNCLSATGTRNVSFISSLLTYKAPPEGGGEPNDPTSPILSEKFEATGYDTAGWTESGTGTLNEDYTTSPLHGSQSLRIVTPSDELTYIYHSITSSSETWIRFKIKVVLNPASEIPLIEMWNISQAPIASLRITSAGTLKVSNGTSISTATSSALVDGTTYYVWFHFKNGTGANGVCDASFDESGNSRPTSGNQFTSLSNGTATQAALHVTLGCIVFEGVNEFIFDRFDVDDVLIP